MKKIFFIFFIIISHFSYSQKILTDKQWIEDLNFMITRLDSVHPNLYAKISGEQFQERVKELRVKIPMLSDNEITVELLKIITSIQDGHTRLHGKNLTKEWYPLRIEKFSDGYYITAITKEQSKFIGAKVIAFNNFPIEKVFEMLNEVTPHDNSYGQEYFAPMFLTMASVLSGLHLIKSTDDVLLITIKSKGNKDEKILLNSVKFETDDELSWFWRNYGVPSDNYTNILQSSTNLPYYLQKYNEPYWFKYIEQKNAVYFAFNECATNKKKNFEKLNASLWRTIDSLNVDFLLIDLRNNLGGTNSICKELLHEIIRHDKINQKGHLFVITSKKTFSAALHCATWIEFHCNPIFVGEPTGAGPNNYADWERFELPNSKMMLLVSGYYWQNSWPWDDRTCIDPTIKVNLSSDDYFNYKDPVMDKIFEYIKQNQQ